MRRYLRFKRLYGESREKIQGFAMDVYVLGVFGIKGGGKNLRVINDVSDPKVKPVFLMIDGGNWYFLYNGSRWFPLGIINNFTVNDRLVDLINGAISRLGFEGCGEQKEPDRLDIELALYLWSPQ